MKMNILAAADALSNQDLLAHLDVLAGRERDVSAELVAHLASLESRPALYAGMGYGSPRILSPHLTPENHQAVLEKAKGRTRRQIEGLVAELAPRPDAPTSIHAREAPAHAGASPP